jgi:uncharacterized protein (DUF1778 family)
MRRWRSTLAKATEVRKTALRRSALVSTGRAAAIGKFRVAEDEDKLVKAAVDSSDTKFSSFVRSAAVAEAHRVLADKRSFELDQDAWEELSELLERPAKVPEGLEELFSKPSVFK